MWFDRYASLTRKSSSLENEGTLQIATRANPSCTFVLQFDLQEFENME